MTDWIQTISSIMSSIDRRVDVVRGHIAAALGIEDPIRVLPYRGYGTQEVLWVKGRVLKDEGIQLREEQAPLWENLVNMYKRFATDEVPNARLKISLRDFQQETVTNREGFFELELTPQNAIESSELWHGIDLSLLEPQPDDRKNPVIDRAEVMVIQEGAQFGVISDIDDTIVHTAATDLLKMIRIVYLGNADSRTPFAGVSTFYQALQKDPFRPHHQAYNPIFYVSSSAWNMYDVFARFMDLNNIPKGPIFLRDIELSLENWLSFQHESHKLEQIQPIFQRLPHLPFLLIGDSGQKDPEIYSYLAKHYPDRVLGILIRDVVPNNLQRQQEIKTIAEAVASYGSELFLFQETQAAIDYAVRKGWISDASKVVEAANTV